MYGSGRGGLSCRGTAAGGSWFLPVSGRGAPGGQWLLGPKGVCGGGGLLRDVRCAVGEMTVDRRLTSGWGGAGAGSNGVLPYEFTASRGAHRAVASPINAQVAAAPPPTTSVLLRNGNETYDIYRHVCNCAPYVSQPRTAVRAARVLLSHAPACRLRTCHMHACRLLTPFVSARARATAAGARSIRL